MRRDYDPRGRGMWFVVLDWYDDLLKDRPEKRFYLFPELESAVTFFRNVTTVDLEKYNSPESVSLYKYEGNMTADQPVHLTEEILGVPYFSCIPSDMIFHI